MRSIAAKLWLAMMILVIIVLLLLWFFQIVFLEEFYTQMRIKEIKKKGAEIVEILETGNQGEFEERLEEFVYNNNLSVELLDRRYNTLYFLGETGMQGHMHMHMNRIYLKSWADKVFTGETISIILTHPRFGSSYALIGIPVKIDRDIEQGLFINFPLVPVQDTVNILKTQLLYISVILLVMALVISFLLSRTFTLPILNITKVAMAMAAGNLGARIQLKQKDEIGRLAEIINHMGEELSKVEQLRKDLIANVSHELRTPLSLIKGYAETIKDVSGDYPEKRKKHLDIIIEEANRLGDMVQEILDFSQMQAGYMQLNIQRFKLNDLLEKIYKKFEIIAEKEGLELELRVDRDVFVEADETKMEQVLYNLLNNAFKHSRHGGKITLALVEDSSNVRIEVIDTGIGIPEKELPYIWDRFYKIDKSGARKMSGTGLGLAIVKYILKAHNCKFGVKSREGQGTKLWFELKRS